MMGNYAGKTMRGLLALPLLAGVFMPLASQPAVAQGGSFVNRVFSSNRQPAGAVAENGVVPAPAAASEVVHQLEEQVRQLTGKVEELNFMVLQMQTQIDELRHNGQAAAAAQAPAEKSAVATPPAAPAPVAEQAQQPAATQKSAAALAPASARFNSRGRLSGSTGAVPEGGNTIADVPQTDNPDELYAIGYQHVLAGDYRAAETVFRAFQERFPQNQRVADASFWLGEALYGQGRYREAAQTYIDVQRNYHGAGHGPENLLKLGMSMARLEEKDVACATLAEVPKRYQDADKALLTRVKEERSRIKCQ